MSPYCRIYIRIPGSKSFRKPLVISKDDTGVKRTMMRQTGTGHPYSLGVY